MDTHGNKVAQEGVDRCPCGSKYFERDRCVDCGTLFVKRPVMTKTAVKQAVREIRGEASKVANVFDFGQNLTEDQRQEAIQEALGVIDGLTAQLREGLLDEEA